MLILILGCRKTDHDGEPVPPPEPPPNPFIDVKVTASVQGRVLDENGKPVENASVRSDLSTTTTDANGIFNLNNIQIGKTAGSVTLEKTGYFKGTRTLMVQSGSVNYVNIELIPKVNKGSFTASAGGLVTIDGGSTVEFSSNSIINTSGNTAYNGTVKVNAAWLDPTSSDLNSRMPGNLTGLDSASQLKLLQTFGMIAVELEGSGGEKLNIASGKKATIKFPIPASLSAQAPETIPLWFFNDTTGLWIEQGMAARQGNFYIGEVAHFSFWNVDKPGEFVSLKMKLTDNAGHSLPFFTVRLTNTQNNSSSYGVTDSAGVVQGPVPSNSPLRREVLNSCGAVISESNIGPFGTDSDLGIVVLTVPEAKQVTISGSAVTCSGNLLQEGYTDVFLDDMYYRAKIENGNFSVLISRCSNFKATALITVTNTETGEKSEPFSLEVESGEYQLDYQRACGNTADQYINYTISDTLQFGFSPPVDSFLSGRYTGGATVIDVKRKDQPRPNTYISFTGEAAPGKYPLHTVKVNNGTLKLVMKDSAKVEVNQYGVRGEFISGGFNAILRDSAGGPKTYNAKVIFRVKRG